MAKQTELRQTEEWGEINLFSSKHLTFYQDETDHEEEALYKYWQEKEQVFPHFGGLDLYLDVVSPPFHFSQEEITKLASIQSGNSEKAKSYTPFSSFRMLNNYKRKFSQFNGEKIKATRFDMSTSHGQKLSSDALIRLAKEKFIGSCSHEADDVFAFSFFGLSNEEAKDVDLIRNLLDIADKVSRQQYDSAKELVELCAELSSNKGNLVQRLAYYFSEALQEKIDRATGKAAFEDSFDLQEEIMSPSLSMLSYYQKLPLCPVLQFAEVQVILDNILGAKMVHIIDLAIRNGMQYTVLMQALSTQGGCSLERIKITAVGSKSKPKIDNVGERLMSLAHSLNIPFLFNVVMVSDMRELNKDLFDLDDEEVIAVYSPTLLASMLVRPNVLEHVMGVIKSINPRVMVVSEEEVDLNSPVFVNRFTEALFFYGAFLDSLEDYMDREDPHRMNLESHYYRPGIRNIVAAEGVERTNRHVGIDVWREFFSGFGMVEVEMSTLCLFQASLLAKEFACGSSCTLDLNENCLIIGWKGTPIFCLSAWRFHS